MLLRKSDLRLLAVKHGFDIAWYQRVSDTTLCWLGFRIYLLALVLTVSLFTLIAFTVNSTYQLVHQQDAHMNSWCMQHVS